MPGHLRTRRQFPSLSEFSNSQALVSCSFPSCVSYASATSPQTLQILRLFATPMKGPCIPRSGFTTPSSHRKSALKSTPWSSSLLTKFLISQNQGARCVRIMLLQKAGSRVVLQTWCDACIRLRASCTGRLYRMMCRISKGNMVSGSRCTLYERSGWGSVRRKLEGMCCQITLRKSGPLSSGQVTAYCQFRLEESTREILVSSPPRQADSTRTDSTTDNRNRASNILRSRRKVRAQPCTERLY
jgi:hypothetical protein